MTHNAAEIFSEWLILPLVSRDQLVIR